MAGRAKENLPGGSLKYQFIYLKVRIYVVTVVTWFPSWQFFLTLVGHIFVPRVQCWTLPCCLVSSLHAPASLALLHWSTCTCTTCTCITCTCTTCSCITCSCITCTCITCTCITCTCITCTCITCTCITCTLLLNGFEWDLFLVVLVEIPLKLTIVRS